MVAQTINENHFLKEFLMAEKSEPSTLAGGLELQFGKLLNSLNYND